MWAQCAGYKDWAHRMPHVPQRAVAGEAPSRGQGPLSLDLIAVDRAAYLAQGFVHVPGVFTADEVAVMRAEAERVSETHGDDRPWGGGWAPAASIYTLLVV